MKINICIPNKFNLIILFFFFFEIYTILHTVVLSNSYGEFCM